MKFPKLHKVSRLRNVTQTNTVQKRWKQSDVGSTTMEMDIEPENNINMVDNGSVQRDIPSAICQSSSPVINVDSAKMECSNQFNEHSMFIKCVETQAVENIVRTEESSKNATCNTETILTNNAASQTESTTCEEEIQTELQQLSEKSSIGTQTTPNEKWNLTNSCLNFIQGFMAKFTGWFVQFDIKPKHYCIEFRKIVDKTIDMEILAVCRNDLIDFNVKGNGRTVPIDSIIIPSFRGLTKEQFFSSMEKLDSFTHCRIGTNRRTLVSCKILCEIPRHACDICAQSSTAFSPINLSTTNSNAKHQYMNREQLLAKLKQLIGILNKTRRALKLLQKKYDSLNQKINEEKTLTDSEKLTTMKKWCETINEDHGLFIQQQMKVALLRDKKSTMKWNPLLIKWCINMRNKTPGAYTSLRQSTFIELPSERTLKRNEAIQHHI